MELLRHARNLGFCTKLLAAKVLIIVCYQFLPEGTKIVVHLGHKQLTCKKSIFENT